MTEQWIDQEKINVIREYLQSEFQACEVTDLEDHDYMAQKFRIKCEGAAYLVTVRRKFLDDNRAPRIGEELLRFQLADYLRKVGNARVFVTDKGCTLDS
jgi:agmatine/peptidylarginine deiminase